MAKTEFWTGSQKYLCDMELAQAFHLARQNAQGVIAAYRRLHPDNICFNASLKRQVATESFEPYYISARPNAFLNYQRGISMVRIIAMRKIGADYRFKTWMI